MPLSMTGFSRFIVRTEEGKLIGEISSVNKKFFELNAFMPKEFYRLEALLRKKIAEKFSRGQISLRLFFYPQEKMVFSLLPKVPLLKALKKGWETRAKALGLEAKSVTLDFLARQCKEYPLAEEHEENKAIDEMFFSCVDHLIEALFSMKKKEGAALVSDIKKRIGKIEKGIDRVEKLAKTSVPKYREKLLQKVGEFFTKPVDEERMLKEILLFAEKIDITEEIVRLHSHIEQFYSQMRTSEAIGRKWEFLVQEIHREINTIGSKSVEASISQEVVEMKSEVEKIREQVQNIE